MKYEKENFLKGCYFYDVLGCLPIVIIVLLALLGWAKLVERLEDLFKTPIPQKQIVLTITPTTTMMPTNTSSPTTTATSSPFLTPHWKRTQEPFPTPKLYIIPTLKPTKPPVQKEPDRINCSPSYPTVCIPPPPPDLDCKDIPYRRFKVLQPDPHFFDGDYDGIGCEWD
jgi:hypothetical protein